MVARGAVVRSLEVAPAEEVLVARVKSPDEMAERTLRDLQEAVVQTQGQGWAHCRREAVGVMRVASVAGRNHPVELVAWEAAVARLAEGNLLLERSRDAPGPA